MHLLQLRHVILLLCQFVNYIEVKKLPVYHPSEEEKEDPKLYAENVRRLMACEVPIGYFWWSHLLAYMESHDIPFLKTSLSFVSYQLNVNIALINQAPAIPEPNINSIYSVDYFWYSKKDVDSKGLYGYVFGCNF